MSSVRECYRGSCVRVFRLDSDGTLARLRQRAGALLEARADVLEVRLFGSLARGEARPGSDADVLIVLRASSVSFLDRGAELTRHFTGIGVGCDILVYTQAELARLQAQGGGLVRAVFREGLVLASRSCPSAERA